MPSKSLRTVLVLVAVSVVMLAGVAAAYALPADVLSLNVPPVAGDTGLWFGNHENGIAWYNKPVSLLPTPTLIAFASSSTVSVTYVGYRFNGSAATSITSSLPHTFTADGVYSIEATGTNAIDLSYEGTRTLGIDRVRPRSTSNRVPVYDATGTITLQANDPLSGPEYVLYTLDDESEYATPTAAIGTTEALTADVVATTAGRHTLSWYAVDNAGNHEAWHTTSFVVNAAGYTPYLGKPKTTVRYRAVRFAGSVTAAATGKTIALTVQRKSGGTWKPFTTYSVSVPRYAGAYAATKHVTKTGTYRVKAAEGLGQSVWSRSFRIR